MLINCIAIDDEPLALSKLTGFLQKIPKINISKTFDNGIEAITFLKEHPVDLIFLDIQMEDFTGIQFLETVQNRPQVVIISAFEQYALKGFELNVTDYILKPYTFERLLQAANKCMDMQAQKLKTLQHIDNHIFIKTENRLERIDAEDICYVEGMKDYLMIVTKNRKIMTLLNFKKMEEMLPSPRFLRVHRSFIVAVNKIEKVERNRIKILDQYIPLSNSFRDEFYKFIGF